VDKGILIDGLTARHPLAGKELPVYTSSYVLNEYGSGAIMGVPFHDERDCAFALENDLPLVQVIEDNRLVNSGEFSGLIC